MANKKDIQESRSSPTSIKSFSRPELLGFICALYKWLFSRSDQDQIYRSSRSSPSTTANNAAFHLPWNSETTPELTSFQQNQSKKKQAISNTSPSQVCHCQQYQSITMRVFGTTSVRLIKWDANESEVLINSNITAFTSC